MRSFDHLEIGIRPLAEDDLTTLHRWLNTRHVLERSAIMIPQAMTRQIELPDLASSYPLRSETVDAYRRDGHVFLSQVVTEQEMAAYRPAIEKAAWRYNVETRPLEERTTYGKAFLQVTNLWAKDETVARYILARRFAKIAGDLMGVDGVRLYHDQALFKEGGGGYTPMHQDHYYWPLDTDGTITMWMPLVDVPAEVGGMRFASGSHTVGYLGDLEISDRSEQVLSQLIDDRGFVLHETGAMAAGDATFHAGWTLHSAPPNPTTMMREVMTIIYFADGARLVEPDTESRKNDLRAWFPGLEPGDIAATDLNPLVYSRQA